MFWGRRRRGGGGGGDAEREPVLLVSGMGGSILNARSKKKSKFEIRVWVRILLANLEFKKYLWSIYNLDTGEYQSPLIISPCYLLFV